MTDSEELTTVSEVRENRSYLFTATNAEGREEELVVVPCHDDGEQPVSAYLNRCTHQDQRLDTGRGVAMREGQVICPRHGSMFDSCTGYCDNGPAADTTLPTVEVTVEDGRVYLTDDDYTFEHEGGHSAGDDGPSSTSHIGF